MSLNTWRKECFKQVVLLVNTYVEFDEEIESSTRLEYSQILVRTLSFTILLL